MCSDPQKSDFVKIIPVGLDHFNATVGPFVVINPGSVSNHGIVHWEPELSDDLYDSDDEEIRPIRNIADISENVIGITHYLGEDDGEWLISNEGKKLFKTINEKKMIVSISCKPKHSKNIEKLAEIFPKMPILLHHMGGMKSNLNDKSENNNILKLSKFKNIFLKFSGYNYVLGEGRRWDFPYNDALWVYKEAYQKFGSNMVWGSDFPVVKFSSTYKQAFEVFNKYCDFMSENDKNLIQGNNLLKLIKERGKID